MVVSLTGMFKQDYQAQSFGVTVSIDIGLVE
jgi:hypothetical protein